MPLGVEYRYYDQPMPGSIYTAPDILNVVRGPTLVRVRYRKEPMRVPAQIKVSKAAGNVHDHSEGDEKTMLLKRILSGIDPSYRQEQQPRGIDFHRKVDDMRNVRPRDQPLV
jgi:hypothetical protein